jgi:hypothetical protein
VSGRRIARWNATLFEFIAVPVILWLVAWGLLLGCSFEFALFEEEDGE